MFQTTNQKIMGLNTAILPYFEKGVLRSKAQDVVGVQLVFTWLSEHGRGKHNPGRKILENAQPKGHMSKNLRHFMYTLW